MKFSTFTKKASVKSKQRGQGMSEYIIITALIAVAGIGVFTAFGSSIRSVVTGMSQEIAGGSNVADLKLATDTAVAATAKNKTITGMGTYGGQNGAVTP